MLTRLITASPLLAVTAAFLASCSRPAPLTHVPAVGALGPYSGSVSAGDLCFVSGKVAPAASGPRDFAEEAAAAIAALEVELQRAGLSLADVVSAAVYLTDIDNYAAFNEVYARRFPPPHPARTLVEVSKLPGDARVEIQAVARRR